VDRGAWSGKRRNVLLLHRWATAGDKAMMQCTWDGAVGEWRQSEHDGAGRHGPAATCPGTRCVHLADGLVARLVMDQLTLSNCLMIFQIIQTDSNVKIMKRGTSVVPKIPKFCK
jgi:hypothetical protein